LSPPSLPEACCTRATRPPTARGARRRLGGCVRSPGCGGSRSRGRGRSAVVSCGDAANPSDATNPVAARADARCSKCGWAAASEAVTVSRAKGSAAGKPKRSDLWQVSRSGRQVVAGQLSLRRRGGLGLHAQLLGARWREVANRAVRRRAELGRVAAGHGFAYRGSAASQSHELAAICKPRGAGWRARLRETSSEAARFEEAEAKCVAAPRVTPLDGDGCALQVR